MVYRKGKHIIASLNTKNEGLLLRSVAFRKFINGVISELDLTHLGEVFHDFSPQGFTGVVCLSESHLSVHTWPEFCLLNVDIYLSSVTKDNSALCEELFEEVVRFFDATVLDKNTLLR